MQLESIVIDFEVDDKKFDIFVLPIGCKTADINFNSKLQITISKIGDKMVVIIIKTPTRPIEFLINTVLDNL